MAATRRYYDHKANPETSGFLKSCLTVRRASPTIELRNFHNDVKRQLLKSFCKPGDRLLDLGCGRGGDLQKWNAVGLGSVLGVDISPQEIQEAEARRSNVQGKTQVDFKVLDLSSKALDSEEPFDVVSCMFAIQYFFDGQDAMNAFFQTVSRNLKEGGIFIGTFPDGDNISAFLGNRSVLECSLFKIQRTTDQKIVFQIHDTVTDGGLEEFLVFKAMFLGVAEKHGLQCVSFERFQPGRNIRNPDLQVASSLFTSFAFVRGPKC